MLESESQPVHIVAEEVVRFEPKDPALYEHLCKHGFAVVKSVMDETSISSALEKLWEVLHSKAGMIRDDPTTWTRGNFSKVGLPSNGILMDFGQTEFMWYLRQLPKVKDAFSTVHDTENLICSMDGGNIFLPWHRDQNSTETKTETGWYHVDQGNSMRGFHCVQGLITLTDVTAASGGLCLIPGSAQHHDELMELTREEYNFVEVPSHFHALKQKQILPLCMAGDMILWDSRTIHCSTPSLVHPTASPDNLLRVAGYVCMTPRDWATQDVISNRVQAYMRDMSLFHWPHIITHEIPDSLPVTKLFVDAPQSVKELIGHTRGAQSFSYSSPSP